MKLTIIQIHPATDKAALNTEWFVVENVGDTVFNTRHCTVAVSRGNSKKRKALGTMDPGFSIGPGEWVRVITGNPGKKAHGKPPDDEMRSYSLFLGAPVLQGPEVVLHLALRTHALARAAFDPTTETGVGATD